MEHATAMRISGLPPHTNTGVAPSITWVNEATHSHMILFIYYVQRQAKLTDGDGNHPSE